MSNRSLLAAAEELLDARESLARYELALKNFPPGMAAIGDGDVLLLTSLEADLDTAERSIAKYKENLAEAEAKIRSNPLFSLPVVSPIFLDTLETCIDRLQVLERELQEAKHTEAAAIGRLEEAARRLSGEDLPFSTGAEVRLDRATLAEAEELISRSFFGRVKTARTFAGAGGAWQPDSSRNQACASRRAAAACRMAGCRHKFSFR